MTQQQAMECLILLKEAAIGLEPNTDLKRRIESFLDATVQEKVFTLGENWSRQMAERNQPCIREVLKVSQQYRGSERKYNPTQLQTRFSTFGRLGREGGGQ